MYSTFAVIVSAWSSSTENGEEWCSREPKQLGEDIYLPFVIVNLKTYCACIMRCILSISLSVNIFAYFELVEIHSRSISICCTYICCSKLFLTVYLVEIFY